jgi:hypothetical protein
VQGKEEGGFVSGNRSLVWFGNPTGRIDTKNSEDANQNNDFECTCTQVLCQVKSRKFALRHHGN